MTAYAFEGVVPVVAEGAFVHPDAVLIGDVVIETGCYIGAGAVLRGDFGRILVEEGANVQDNCVAHTFPGESVRVCRGGHVGHGVILHGCCVGENALIGMNSVLMDGVVIGKNSFVAAMSFVKAGACIDEGVVVAGQPARFVRKLKEYELLTKVVEGTGMYRLLAQRCCQSLKPVTPLKEVEAGRPTIHWPEPLSTSD